jgi:hypothetical protein
MVSKGVHSAVDTFNGELLPMGNATNSALGPISPA